MVPENNNRGPNLLLFVVQAAQVLLLLAVAQAFLIEQAYGLTRLLPVVFVGFVIHAWLPPTWRVPFFVLLFPVSAVALLGAQPAAVLVLLAIALFGICHLPVPIWMRAAIMLAVAALLAAIRGGAIELPGTANYLRSQTLPILAAMFMFRTIIYLYDLRHEKKPVSIWQRLAYFFLFPNVCFPLFPVIDYQAFKRTSFDRAPHEIYQKGIDWILRGITHLLLYRLVYHYFVPDPVSIHDIAGVAQYALSSFLLYLRVSGLFHLTIGILCLFGYNLPETHHRYYLSESFTDFWRRINIYWKDFMVKLFYFPLFVALRRWGVTTAMIAATLITFFFTWLLHSYQWFWLRGTFPLHPQDMIFWGVLAVLVTINSLWEEKYGRKRRSLRQGGALSFRQALGRSVKTVSVFIAICLLWSFWTSASIDQWLTVMSMAATASAWQVVTAALLVILAVAIGVFVQVANADKLLQSRRERIALPYRAARVGVAGFFLLALATPWINVRFDQDLGTMIATVTGDKLNTRDQQVMLKGYYEELLGAESAGAMAWSIRPETPDDWRWDGKSQSVYTAALDDIRSHKLQPHISATHKEQEFRTNRWGMRDDDDYTLDKPDDTLRIALLGSSHAVGAGVRTKAIFPSLLEQWLNESNTGTRYRKIEVLNFAYFDDSVLRRAVRLDKEALPFSPDVVIDVAVTGEMSRAIRNLRLAIQEKASALDPDLRAMIVEAGVTSDMSDDEIEVRLGVYEERLVEKGYSALAETARQHDIRVLVFLLPKLEDSDNTFDEEWERLTGVWEAEGLEAVSLRDVYGPPNGRDRYKIAEWDAHPNAAGHFLVAERLFEEVSKFEPISLTVETIARRQHSIDTN